MPTTELGDENLAHRPFDIIIFGLGLYGNSIAKSLEKAGFKVFGVDFDPKAVKRWKKKGRAAQYGDADDPELHEILPLSAQCIISTITDKQINFALIKYLKLGDFKGHIAMTSYTGRTAKELEKAGADLILLPFADAAEGIPEKLKSLKKKEE